jgi:hypothetical protein
MRNVEKLLSLPKLGKDDTFTFGCNRCGKCCRNREDILLTPLDLFKIARYLNKSIQEVMQEYCESYEGSGSKIPVVRIKPREYRLTCPFAKKEGFTVLWHKKIGELSEILQNVYAQHSFNHDYINTMLLLNLYVLYDLEADFMPQFERNGAEALRVVRKIADESAQRIGEGA